MWIKRDLSLHISKNTLLEAVVLLGPRQVGKSSLLTNDFPDAAFLSLDDLSVRERARTDPKLLIQFAHSESIIFDEFQYAPQLLSEIKLQIDERRRSTLKSVIPQSPRTRFFLSGSNQIDIEKSLRETLAGRASLFTLHGLSVGEISNHDRTVPLSAILFRGGFPELYVRSELNVIDYLNDYISTFVEKDVARSAGIQKIDEFMLVTRLLAARAGQLMNNDSVASDAGVAPKTVADWCGVLERARIIFSVPVYSTNLNSRLIKTPKIYFIDTGLLVRLQGHLEEKTILSTPHAGHIFENLVIAEVLKTKDHFKQPWSLSYWRTKEKEEIDLIVEFGMRRIFIEAKLAIQNITPIRQSSSLQRTFGERIKSLIVTPAGEALRLSEDSTRVPITGLAEELLKTLA